MSVTDESFEAFMVVVFQVKAFWVVMLCCVVVGCQCFRGPYCWRRRQHRPLECWYPITWHDMECHNPEDWRWRQHGPLKCWYSTMTLRGVMTQKTSTWNFSSYWI